MADARYRVEDGGYIYDGERLMRPADVAAALNGGERMRAALEEIVEVMELSGSRARDISRDKQFEYAEKHGYLPGWPDDIARAALEPEVTK